MRNVKLFLLEYCLKNVFILHSLYLKKKLTIADGIYHYLDLKNRRLFPIFRKVCAKWLYTCDATSNAVARHYFMILMVRTVYLTSDNLKAIFFPYLHEKLNRTHAYENIKCG